MRIDFHEASFNSSLLNYFVRATGTSWPSTIIFGSLKLEVEMGVRGYNLAVTAMLLLVNKVNGQSAIV